MNDWEPLGNDWQTPEEIAEIFRVTVSSVKKAAARGELPAIKIGPYWRISTAATRFVPLEPQPEEAE